MPDPLKLAVLRDAGYVQRDTCRVCKHIELPVGWAGGLWASCALTPSAHEKHTDGGRLSVTTTGWCPKFEMSQRYAEGLARSGFDVFKEKTDGR